MPCFRKKKKLRPGLPLASMASMAGQCSQLIGVEGEATTRSTLHWELKSKEGGNSELSWSHAAGNDDHIT